MKIITWNVNSIRVRIEQLQRLIYQEAPDVVLLQELKCETEKFPEDQLADLPYNFYVCGQKTYNGVAILSKFRADEVISNLPGSPCPEQARFIEIACMTGQGFYRFISLYAPNGGEVGSDKFVAKLAFYDALTEYLRNKQSPEEKLIIGGDFNIAPFDIDVYNPAALRGATCFTNEEKRKIRAILNNGFFDMYRLLNPQKQEFSWWDYRSGAFEQNKGLRIDTILACGGGAADFTACDIDYQTRAQKSSSDHAPVILR